MATYEIVLAGAAKSSPGDVVTDLPPATIGEVIFHNGAFWRVDAIDQPLSEEADGRLLVTRTTDAPKGSAA